MRRDRALTQVQLEYERLRGDRPDLSHKELWQQAEDIAASNRTFDEEVWNSAEYTGERPPRWPMLLIGISGALIGPLLLVGVFLSFGSIMEVGSSGSVSSQTQSFLAIIGWHCLSRGLASWSESARWPPPIGPRVSVPSSARRGGSSSPYSSGVSASARHDRKHRPSRPPISAHMR